VGGGSLEFVVLGVPFSKESLQFAFPVRHSFLRHLSMLGCGVALCSVIQGFDRSLPFLRSCCTGRKMALVQVVACGGTQRRGNLAAMTAGSSLGGVRQPLLEETVDRATLRARHPVIKVVSHAQDYAFTSGRCSARECDN
jgi:hypothetical protein